MRIALFAIMIVCLSCGSSFAAANKSGQRGAIEGILKDDSGADIIRYAGVVPPKLPSHRLFGLIVGLHGKGGDEKQQIGHISKALAANGLADQYVILGLKAKGELWEDGDVEPVAKAIAWAMKTYPIDPRRGFAWGFSSGAFFTGKFGPRHQDLLAGGVVQCGGVPNPPAVEDGGEGAIQLYIIHGEKDTMVDVKSAHDACEHLSGANYRFVYRELTGDDHGLNGPGGEPARRDATRFINALRNRLVPLSDAEKKLLAEMTTKLDEAKVNPPAGYFAPLANLAGPETDAVMVKGLQSPKPEIRLHVAVLCQDRLFGKPVIDALPALLKDKDAKIRAAAIYGLGLAANFQQKEAVTALAAFAKDTANPATDRLNAVGQLGVTMALQTLCVNQDTAIIGMLKELSDDKNSQIRQMAALSLDGKLTFDGQRYQADK